MMKDAPRPGKGINFMSKAKDLAYCPVLWEDEHRMDMAEQEKLVKLACAGNAGAFRTLLDIHYATVFRMAFHLCGHREDAEDITQMACLKIAQNIGSFRQDSKFTTWIYTIVLNTFRDWADLRANNKKGHVALDIVADILPGSANPEQDMHTKEMMKKIHDLPAPEREALIVVFAEGLSHKEAAAVLGCAESTVSWRIHEARKKLGGL